MDKVVSITLRLALFLFIANIIMLFIVEPMCAEFIVTVISAVLMLALVATIVIVRVVKDKKERGKESKKDD